MSFELLVISREFITYNSKLSTLLFVLYYLSGKFCFANHLFTNECIPLHRRDASADR